MDRSNDSGANRVNKKRSEDQQIYNQNNRLKNRRRTNISLGDTGDQNDECIRKSSSRQLNRDAYGEFLSLSLSLAQNHPSSPPQNHLESPPPQPATVMVNPESPAPLTFNFLSPNPPSADFLFPPAFAMRSVSQPEPHRSIFAPAAEQFTTSVPPRRSSQIGVGGREPRRNNTTQLDNGKSSTVPPPFPWATNQRASIHSLGYLESNHITTITGDVQCKHCDKIYQISFNLMEKFSELEEFIKENKGNMRERAPPPWMNPVLPRCEFCKRDKAAKPVIGEKKREINWLFMLLGKTLGCCTLEQLKYFCKHSKNHRTGAKDRVLYLTYLSLCKQLKSCELFDR